eukprot:1153638-Pelagomonas_calceolata.AAC.2
MQKTPVFRPQRTPLVFRSLARQGLTLCEPQTRQPFIVIKAHVFRALVVPGMKMIILMLIGFWLHYIGAMIRGFSCAVVEEPLLMVVH